MKENLEINSQQDIDLQINKKFEELNSICSYLAMFPSAVPREYIKKYTVKGDIVFDPFSGRGTTTLEAIKLKRIAISNDLSPLAFILTQSKSSHVSFNDAIKYVEDLEKEFNNSRWDISSNLKKYKDIKVFYSRNNLIQLDFLRENLGKKWRENNETQNFILSIVLGIAHGQTRKTGDKNNSLYFSVNMPNGYSMAPKYAKKYIKNNNLYKIKTNIFTQIKYRIEKKRSDFLQIQKGTKTYFGDALHSSRYFLNQEKPKLIFTSPPYLNLIKYIEQNWIRFWLLGFNKEETKGKIVNDYHAREEYKIFLSNFMLEMEKIMIPNETKLIMVIGDVNKHKIKEIISEIEMKYLKGSKLTQICTPEKQLLKNKLSRTMGHDKKGQATKYDWVFTYIKETSI